MHTDKKEKCILGLGEGPPQKVYDTAIIGEAQYFINCTRSNKFFSISMHTMEVTVFCMLMV